ncbi:hypothetical protein IQ243_08785 [Nostocales cyanobacterium LEGE 11386]|nr:hypothetical protein [Nostocales cyanobacterium LEGE 11386]
MKNSQKINKFLVRRLITITLATGNFLTPVASIASESTYVALNWRDIDVEAIIDGVKYGIACYKGGQRGWITEEASLPGGWSADDIINASCQTVAAGGRYFSRRICPNCFKEYKQHKEYQVAQCRSRECRSVRIYVKRA